jgi:hypothetical protein
LKILFLLCRQEQALWFSGRSRPIGLCEVCSISAAAIKCPRFPRPPPPRSGPAPFEALI